MSKTNQDILVRLRNVKIVNDQNIEQYSRDRLAIDSKIEALKVIKVLFERELAIIEEIAKRDAEEPTATTLMGNAYDAFEEIQRMLSDLRDAEPDNDYDKLNYVIDLACQAAIDIAPLTGNKE
jgi:lipoate synthase